VSPDKLSVDGEVLEARHFVIAAGAKPRRLGVPGEEHLVTSTAFLELDQLPPRIAFVGAGYISFEFAHVARRAGAQVMIVGRGKPLQHFEQDLVTRLVDHTRSLGIELRLDAEVTAIEQRGAGYRLRVNRQGRTETVEADLVVHGGGRVPNTEGLALGTANVATEPDGGVRVNEFLQSVTNPRAYAAGDAAASAGSLPLTPVAAYEGTIVGSNLLKGNTRTPDYRGIPSVVFTVPPLAGVGLTETEAQQRQLDVRVKTQDTSGWYSNRRVAETCAMFKSDRRQQGEPDLRGAPARASGRRGYQPVRSGDPRRRAGDGPQASAVRLPDERVGRTQYDLRVEAYARVSSVS
jgi:glutathione reductase (NADPH)